MVAATVGVRARIYGRREHFTPTRRSTSGATVRLGPTRTWIQWHMEVLAGDTVLLYDDCRDLAKLHDQAAEMVAAFRRIYAIGYKTKPGSYRELVDRSHS